MAKRRTIGKNPLDALSSLSSQVRPPRSAELTGEHEGSTAESTIASVEAPGTATDSVRPVEHHLSAPEDHPSQAQYLTFHLAGGEYALDVLRVREIIEYQTVTKVPRTSPAIRGVINLRGSVVPVLDLAAKLGLDETPIDKQTCIVFVEATIDAETTLTGVMVDGVTQVLELQRRDIEPVQGLATAVQVDYLLGMGKAGDKLVLILDVDRALSFEESQADVTGRQGLAREEHASPEAVAQVLGA